VVDPRLTLASSVARRAGELLRQAYAAEDVILELLSPAGMPVLCEESGLVGDAEDTGPRWIVDPLDGTANYQRRIPLSCVSIGLFDGETPILGVIYDFHRDELFEGVVGDGAWLNGEVIQVSDRIEPGMAVLATGFPVATSFDDAALLDRIRQFQAFKKIRLIGSAALSCAWVAAGRVDAYHERDIQLWDIAAGVALVRAAGGHVAMEPTDRGPYTRAVHCAAHEDLWK
jgi:myo-inositol-1(or 4)-monophosphatase